MHLLLPFALTTEPEGQRVLRELALPNLSALLPLLTERVSEDHPAHSPDLPHERVLARALGWPETHPLPWAAQRAATLGLPTHDRAYAFITPCHWAVGTADVRMLDPQHLGLQDDESRQLRQAIQAYAQDDGITFHDDEPLRWLASGEVFRELRSASVQRVIGQDLAPWMPASATLRRLQNEMQMLLYTHPVNDARMARRALPVNSFWISGSGVLPAPSSGTPSCATPSPQPQVVEALSAPALSQDWPAWAQAWHKVDATHIAELLRRARAGDAQVQLTLCSDTRSTTLRRDTAQRAVGSQAWHTLRQSALRGWQAWRRTHWLDTL